MTSDEQDIRGLLDEWHRCTANGDLDRILPMISEDAVFLRCGLPPMNKAEFARGFREWSGKARIESRFDVKDIRASDDIAYVWSYIAVDVNDTATGARSRREGDVLSVFRKSASGKWLLARDANLLSH